MGQKWAQFRFTSIICIKTSHKTAFPSGFERVRICRAQSGQEGFFIASGQTQYYGLSQWEAVDKVERVDFNSDNAKIDGALRALAEQAGRKADKSTVTNLSSVVSQKADETALTAAEKRVSALERGKAEQVALDGAVSQLREENRMVFLGRTALNTAASSFDLPVPDWTGYWELQLHYDLRGSGEIKLSFNDGEAYYVSALGSTGTAIGLKYQRGTCGTGVIVLRRCGASGRLGCYINGASLNEKGTDSSGLNSFYTLNSLTAAALTHLRLHSEGGTISSGSAFAFYAVK